MVYKPVSLQANLMTMTKTINL